MALRITVSKILWTLLAGIWFLIGFMWITATEFEPIHEKLIEGSWEDQPQGVQEVILFLMRICSGMCLGIGGITLFMVLGPLKNAWCCTIKYLFVLNFLALLPLTVMNIRLRFFRIPNIKEPNWILASLSLALSVFGLILGFKPCIRGVCKCLPVKEKGGCCSEGECKTEKKEL